MSASAVLEKQSTRRWDHFVPGCQYTWKTFHSQCWSEIKHARILSIEKQFVRSIDGCTVFTQILWSSGVIILCKVNYQVKLGLD